MSWDIAGYNSDEIVDIIGKSYKCGFSRNNWNDSGTIMIYVCLKVGYTPSLLPLKLEFIEAQVVFGLPPLVGNTCWKHHYNY